jgi:hypothetical protein
MTPTKRKETTYQKGPPMPTDEYEQYVLGYEHGWSAGFRAALNRVKEMMQPVQSKPAD